MKKNIFLVLCISFICFSCSAEAEWEKLKVKEVVKTDPVIDWSATADSCTYVLIEQFMNKEKGTFWKSPESSQSSFLDHIVPQHSSPTTFSVELLSSPL